MEARPVKDTLDTVLGAGGTKKSSTLWAAPPGVARESRPDVAPPGTGTERFVVVDDVIGPGTMLNRRRLLVGVNSKFVPVTATAMPGVPIVGGKLVLVGAPLEAVTLKGALLLAEAAAPANRVGAGVVPSGMMDTRLVG